MEFEVASLSGLLVDLKLLVSKNRSSSKLSIGSLTNNKMAQHMRCNTNNPAIASSTPTEGDF